jgi:hypothetical protein
MKYFYICIKISLFFLFLSAAQAAEPATSLSALDVAKNVVNRTASKARVGYMHFTMRNKSGSERKRSALLVHSQEPAHTKIGIYFTKPAGLKDTSFLSHDNSDSYDQNWLYLPATERVRKLPASSRGNYFMGTDLSYGDIKDNFKFALEDWDFSLGKQQIENGKNYYVLQGTPKNEDIKQELGYASFSSKIDPQTWFPVNIKYTDIYNVSLKEVSILALEMIADTWIATHFSVFNSQLSHQTEIVLSNMQYAPNLPSNLLTADELPYGAPLMLLTEGE